ncbi:MAG: adenine phosphoribosyltransferase [Eubacteriales bacterium]
MGAALAYALGAGFVLARKPGKLPCETMRYEYGLEYGTDVLEIHKDSIQPGQKVVIVDDLLATGGTALATVKLVEQAGGEVVGLRFAIELSSEFDGRTPLAGYDVQSVLQY